MVNEGFRIYKINDFNVDIEFVCEGEVVLTKAELEELANMLRRYWLIRLALDQLGIREVKVKPISYPAEFKRIYP